MERIYAAIYDQVSDNLYVATNLQVGFLGSVYTRSKDRVTIDKEGKIQSAVIHDFSKRANALYWGNQIDARLHDADLIVRVISPIHEDPDYWIRKLHEPRSFFSMLSASECGAMHAELSIVKQISDEGTCVKVDRFSVTQALNSLQAEPPQVELLSPIVVQNVYRSKDERVIEPESAT